MRPIVEGTVRRVMPRRALVSVDGENLLAHVRGALKEGPRRSVHVVAVGDRVRLSRTPSGESWLEEVLPRRNVVARVDPGNARGERRHDLAANLDGLVVVASLDRPRFHSRAVDRLLVLGEISGVPARLVCNKLDRRGLPGVADPGELLEPYRRAGYPVHETSARDRAGLEPLRDALAGRISLLLGPSGAGKSTLVNVLFGTDLRTEEVSRATSKGVHTTTRVEWIDLPCGGAVLDSPGIRSILPAGLRRGTLAVCFPELRDLEACQFADCLHRGEAGCAVEAAIRDGRLPAARHESYLRLLKTLPA